MTYSSMDCMEGICSPPIKEYKPPQVPVVSFKNLVEKIDEIYATAHDWEIKKQNITSLLQHAEISTSDVNKVFVADLLYS